MASTRIRDHSWTESELSFLSENYGFGSTEDLCSALGMTKQQVYARAKGWKLTGLSSCKACGRKPLWKSRAKTFYCTQSCRRRGPTLAHKEHVSKNRLHIRQYVNDRKRRFWGLSNRRQADKAERVAFERGLPRLGFTELFHASIVNRFLPFDVIASFKGNRVLIDVTTAVSKTLLSNYANTIAEELRMPLYISFIKPDLKMYQLVLGTSLKSVSVHLKGLSAVE